MAKEAADAGAARAVVARMGWATVAVAPPAAAAVWWPGLAGRPWWTLTAVLVYESVLLAGALLKGVAGKLLGRWEQRLTDQADDALRRRFSRFRSRYLEHLHYSTRGIEQVGVPRKTAWTPPLDKVYVDVALVHRPAHETYRDALVAQRQVPGPRRSLRSFLDEGESIVIAILGAPGIGKTTLLRRTAHELSSPSRLSWGRRRTLPVLLRLRDHARLITEGGDTTLPGLIVADINGRCGQEPPGWFERQLKDGACLVMLDGLDEVASEADRAKIVLWVGEQVNRYHKSSFVLTSRPHGYVDVEGAVVVQAQPFTSDQITEFAYAWYTAHAEEKVGQRHLDAEARQTRIAAKVAAGHLLEDLHTRRDLWLLATNPLLLTMLSILHENNSALPRDRAQLYSDIVELLVWRRQRDKRGGVELHGDLPGKQKELVLSELAFAMMAGGVTVIDAADARELVDELLPDISCDRDAATFLADSVAAGLLIEPSEETYAFAHKTFQEYLAAVNVKENARVDRLAAEVGSDWWRETILLFVARSPADSIIEACLDRDDVDSLALVFDCAETLHKLDRRLKKRLSAVLAEAGHPSTSPARRRLLTAVTVKRAVRGAVPLPGGAELCARPLSQEVHRLFLRDLSMEEIARLVLAPGPAAPAGAPGDTPAVYASAIEVSAVLTWVRSLLPDGPAVRLPTAAELSSPEVRAMMERRGHGVWIADSRDTSRPSLWLPEGTPNPWSTTADRVLTRATADAESFDKILKRAEVLRLTVTALDVVGVEYARDALYTALRELRSGSKTGAPHAALGPAREVVEIPTTIGSAEGRDAAAVRVFADELLDRVRDCLSHLGAPSAADTTGDVASALGPALHRRHDIVITTSGGLAHEYLSTLESAFELRRLLARAVDQARRLTTELGVGPVRHRLGTRDRAGAIAEALSGAYDHISSDPGSRWASLSYRAVVGVIRSALPNALEISSDLLVEGDPVAHARQLAESLAGGLGDAAWKVDGLARAAALNDALYDACFRISFADAPASSPGSSTGPDDPRALALLDVVRFEVADVERLAALRAVLREQLSELAAFLELSQILQRLDHDSPRTRPGRWHSVLETIASGVIVDPSRTAHLLGAGLNLLAGMRIAGAGDQPELARHPDPAVALAALLARVGLPELTGKRPPARRTAAMVMFGALAAAFTLGQRPSEAMRSAGGMYVEVAAGMSTLLDRLEGRTVAAETITLVMEKGETVLPA
ncbi:NACHT domain-containing NTPase [Microbispora sp. NPDC049125]|uniref:NACHT domain-containing protein n=1 Tax=Microbispora sp. NPDC049125 TaxID=3154929 RepID=UPI0034657058